MTLSVVPSRVSGAHPSTDEIDALVHGLIDAHFAGQMSEEEARRRISGALYASGVHEDVAKTRTDLTQQGRNDLAEMLLTLLTEKVIGSSDNGYSLETGRRTSACGWARQMAKAAIASEMRNARRADTRNGTPLDPTGFEFSVIGQTHASLIVWDTEAVHVDGEVADLAEQYAQIIKGMRDTDRMVVNADTICLGLGVNPAVRPEWMDDRDDILTAITADETLAQRSLMAWRSLVIGSERDFEGCDIDDRLLALWDDQTEDSAGVILSKSAEVAHTLALAAVSPLPRPAKKALKRLKTAVMAAPSKRDKTWRELASVLIDSYIASEFEAVSQYATMSAEAKQAAVTGHTISRGRFQFLLNRAANHQGSPLGRTPERVLQCLNDVAAAAFATEPNKSSLRDKAAA